MFGFRRLSAFERRDLRDRKRAPKLAERYIKLVMQIEALSEEAKIKFHEKFDAVGPWLGFKSEHVPSESKEDRGFTSN